MGEGNLRADGRKRLRCGRIPQWVSPPDNTSQYEVFNTSTWTQVSDVPNDNESGDGTTAITWDLQ